jgi:ABC-2 type transport system permease protein
MKRIISQCVKELAQFRRDRLTVALAFLLPLATMLIFGYAIRLESKNIPIVVQDFSNTPLSRSYTERFFATNQFHAANWQGDGAIQSAIDRGLAKAAIIIPPDFSSQIKASQPSEVQVLVDGTDVNNARIIKASIQATTQFFLRTSGLQPDPIRITVRNRIWFNPGREETLYIVPGTCAVVLWIYPSLLAAIAMARDKEKNTIIQLYASTLSATELILGKGIAYLIVGLGEALFILTLSVTLFGLRLAGDPTPLIVGIPLFITTAVLFGILVGSRTGNQNSAVNAVATGGFLTALLLSGFIYPLSNIPFPLSLISHIIPTRYFIVIIRDTFIRGAGWSSVWLPTLMLILLALLLFNAARRHLSTMQLPD